ncbi:hypothetical protein ABZ319_37700, partial [Nocardia sp. NPDC005978]
MTRELPFDDETGAGDEYSGDTAYRIATGVARVTRAGAYVTGGALVAAAGSRGEQSPINHDSRNVGWSQVNDPQPDVPSPTLTFPDLTPSGMPQAGYGGVSPVAETQHHGTDAGLFPSHFGESSSSSASMAGFGGLGLPDSDAGFTLPVSNANPSGGGFTLPGVDSDADPALPGAGDADFALPGAEHGFTLPGMEPGASFSLPGLNLPGPDGGVHMPGLGSGYRPPELGDLGSPSLPEGVNFDQLGLYLRTDWSVDAHIGLDGIRFQSDLKVDIGFGNVGDQLDQFGQDLGQGISHIPGGPAAPGLEQPAQPLAAGARPADGQQPAATVGQHPADGAIGAPGAPSAPGAAPAPGVSPASAPAAAAPAGGFTLPSAGAPAPALAPAPVAPVA